MKRVPAIPVWLLALMFFLAHGSSTLIAADQAAPVHPVDGSFVREWLVLGPFPGRDFKPDFLADVGGEANVRPKEGDPVTRSEGTRLTWTRFRSEYDLVSLEEAFGIQSWSVAYAYCELSSDRPTETDVLLPPFASLIWVNGKKVEPGSIHADSFRGVPVATSIQLQKGVNSCLLKLRIEAIDAHEWHFSLQPLPTERAAVELWVTDAQGRAVPGAVVQLYDRGRLAGRAITDSSGQARGCFFPLAKAYDLRVTSGETGAWLYEWALRPGERRELKVGLSPTVSISGRVLAMDSSPQHAIVVQALRVPERGGDGASPVPPVRKNGDEPSPPRSVPEIHSLLPMPPFSETVLSDTNGYFRFVNLRPGAYRMRCHDLDGYISPDSNPGETASQPTLVSPGRTNEPVRFVFPNPKKGVWRDYAVTRGLDRLGSLSIHRSPDGLLWVGTGSGTVHSYDGVEFKIFQSPQIPGNAVKCIDHDSAGTVWIGTSGGISRSVNGQFLPLALGDSFPRSYVRSISANPDGSVWFTTSSGVGKYEHGKIVNMTVRDGLLGGDLLCTREGAVWVGIGGRLAKFEGGKLSVPLVISPHLLDFRRLRQSKDGAIWILIGPPGRASVYRFDGRTLKTLGTEEGMLSDDVYAMAETSNGDLWFGTPRGLSRFNGATLVNYTEQDGLSDARIKDIFVDEDDVLWLATDSGVVRFDPNTLSGFTQRDGFESGANTPAVFTIEPDPQDGFWVGTQWGGTYRINHQKHRPVITPAGPHKNYVRQISCDENGTLWLGTASGLYNLVEGTLNKVLERSWILALTRDARGRLWFGRGWVGGGASRFDPVTGTESMFTKTNGLPDDSVWALEASSDGGVWIGTGAGLARANGETVDDETRRLKLPAAAVFGLRRDASGTLWISTGRGLYAWNGTNTVSITATNGLPDEHVWCSASARDGTIWIGTQSHGLIGYDGKAVTVLDKRDGLPGNNVFALAADGDDSLWAGFLDGGLTRYRRSKSRPSVRLLEVKLGDQTVTNLTSVPKVEIRRPISIQYHGIDLKTLPEKRQFHYRLANASGQTVLAGVTKDRKFDWTPQKGGAYTFEVQAIDRDLNYSTPVRLAFRATVPWYANAWITVPGGVTFVGLIIWAFIARALYRRKSREAALLRERVRIARDMHDHLGAGLTHLAMVGDLVRNQANQPVAVEMLGTRLTESARELTRTMGEIIWATDPDKDTLRSFALFINSYADRFLAGGALRLRFEFPAEIPDLVLPAEHRSSLLTVTKEALNNVAKHANASELRIRLELRDDELHLCFEDDGRGFLMSEVPADRRGLANMQQRLRDLGGQLTIESVPGQGTQVHARLRLPRK